MSTSDVIRLISCKIERGGFSSERTFEIQLTDGDKLVGTAFFKHFTDGDKRPLDEDAPSYGDVIDGYVRCRLLREDDGGFLIEVPSADVIRVPAADLVND